MEPTLQRSYGACSDEGRIASALPSSTMICLGSDDTLHRDCEDLALLVRELAEHEVPLGLAQPLDDDLLGRLRGYAARAVGQLPRRDQVPNLGFRPYLLGVGEADLDVRVLDLFRHGPYGEHADVARVGVELDRDVLPGCHAVTLVGGDERSLNRREHDLPRQVALGSQLRQSDYEIAFHLDNHPPLQQRKVGVPHFLKESTDGPEDPVSIAAPSRRYKAATIRFVKWTHKQQVGVPHFLKESTDGPEDPVSIAAPSRRYKADIWSTC